MVFVGAFIYDVLCGFFYLAALTYYVHIRKKDIIFAPLQLLIFLVLYVLALNSKEMAVTLPVIVLIYEFLKVVSLGQLEGVLPLVSGFDAAPSLIAGAVTAIYLYSKIHGSGSAYNIWTLSAESSWHNFIVSPMQSFVGELFFATQQLLQQPFCFFCGRLFSFTPFCAGIARFDLWPSG